MNVMWTVAQAAQAWGVSVTTVRKYILQGRVACEKVSRDWIILDDTRPTRLSPGELTEEQRSVWKK